MKKSGIMNAQLAGLIAGLGHMETFLVGDAGLPVPKGIPLVDLAVVGGVPTFIQVMDAILGETVIEKYTLANEIEGKNDILDDYLKQSLSGIERVMIPHTEFKEMTKTVKFAVRTGEFTPYANVILQGGVAFTV